MEYTKDEQGQIKVMDDKGKIKWLPEKLIQDSLLMKRMKFTIVPKPIVLEQFQESNVADVSEAERPSKKQKQK